MSARYSLLSALAVGLLILAGFARAAAIHVLPAVDAEALVPVIRPLLGEDDYVNAYRDKLIIRTDAATFARIEKTLDRLAGQPRTVTIFLRRGGTALDRTAGVTIDRRGAVVDAASSHEGSRRIYSVNTLSGYAAGISQGSLVALAGGDSPVVVRLEQGLRVVPQVLADGRVRLRISQGFDEFGDDGARTQGSYSTLLLIPGQWQPLGGIAVSENSVGASLGGAGTRVRRTSLPLDVKVELR